MGCFYDKFRWDSSWIVVIVHFMYLVTEYHTDRDTGNDFTEVFPSADLVIKGNGEHNVVIPTTADNACEGDETFNVYLTGIDGGVLGFSSSHGSQCQAKVTIKDDDGKLYSFLCKANVFLRLSAVLSSIIAHSTFEPIRMKLLQLLLKVIRCF